MRGTGASGQRRGPYKTSQGGPFCLAGPFLWIQQECSLQNLAPVAWHLVKLIHRQETNCQIKWVSSGLPLPSRLACGRDDIAWLPLSCHVTAKRPLLSYACERNVQKGEWLHAASESPVGQITENATGGTSQMSSWIRPPSNLCTQELYYYAPEEFGVCSWEG